MVKKRGNYILFEGVEGCGKTTQAKLLHDYFSERNIGSVLLREPGGTSLGDIIRKILLDKKSEIRSLEAELFLFESARAELFAEEIIPNLERNNHVIADRGYFSSEVYQGYGRGMDLSMIMHLNNIATYGIKPNLAFIFDIPVNVGLESKKDKDRIESLGTDFHEKVRIGFLEIAAQNKDFCILIKRGNKQIEEIQEEVKHYVKERLDLP
ncbi:MAG: dTMP kinase [Nanoarchaeota archaeon]